MFSLVIVAEPMVGTNDIDVTWRKCVKPAPQLDKLVGTSVPDFGLPCDEHWCPAFEVLDVAVEEVGYPVYVATIARILRSDGQPARLYGVG